MAKKKDKKIKDDEVKTADEEVAEEELEAEEETFEEKENLDEDSDDSGEDENDGDEDIDSNAEKEDENGDDVGEEDNEESEEEDEDDEDKPKKQDEGVVIINSDIPEEAKWYVVHTYSGHENKVATTLKQRVEAGGFVDRVFKLFIPQQQKIVVSEGKKRTVEERLFPGYVIVQMLLDDDSWYVVRSTPGVTGFVGMGSTPTPLPEAEVKSLMRFAQMEAPKFEAKFRVGDSVKIKDGPFKDFLGKVDEVNEDQGKVKVLVSVFGRETPVELDFEQVVSL